MIYQQLKDANIAALKNHDVNARSVLSVLLNKIKLAEIEKRTQNQSPGRRYHGRLSARIPRRTFRRFAE